MGGGIGSKAVLRGTTVPRKFHRSFITFLLRQCVKIKIVECCGLMRDSVTGTALSTSKQTAEKLVGFVLLTVSICLLIFPCNHAVFNNICQNSEKLWFSSIIVQYSAKRYFQTQVVQTCHTKKQTVNIGMLGVIPSGVTIT